MLQLPPTVINIDALDSAKPLAEIFQPAQSMLEKWTAKAESLIVTNISQKTEMAQARLARLELRDARCTLDKTRKGLTEHLKARTSAIDGAARVIREKLESLEAKLLESELFAVRYAEGKKIELRMARDAEMRPFLDGPIMGDLSDMDEAIYAQALADARLLRKTKLEAAARAKAELQAAAEAVRVEHERIEADNARLRAEAAAAEKLAEIERQQVAAQKAETERLFKVEWRRVEAARVEEARRAKEEAAEAERIFKLGLQRLESENAAKLDAERQARADAAVIAAQILDKIKADSAKVNAALAAKAQAEADALAAKVQAEVESSMRAEEAARAAAAAPDKAKLLAFAVRLRQLELPILVNHVVFAALRSRIGEVADWAEARANTI